MWTWESGLRGATLLPEYSAGNAKRINPIPGGRGGEPPWSLRTFWHKNVCRVRSGRVTRGDLLTPPQKRRWWRLGVLGRPDAVVIGAHPTTPKKLVITPELEFFTDLFQLFKFWLVYQYVQLVYLRVFISVTWGQVRLVNFTLQPYGENIVMRPILCKSRKQGCGVDHFSATPALKNLLRLQLRLRAFILIHNTRPCPSFSSVGRVGMFAVTTSRSDPNHGVRALRKKRMCFAQREEVNGT